MSGSGGDAKLFARVSIISVIIFQFFTHPEAIFQVRDGPGADVLLFKFSDLNYSFSVVARVLLLGTLFLYCMRRTFLQSNKLEQQ